MGVQLSSIECDEYGSISVHMTSFIIPLYSLHPLHFRSFFPFRFLVAFCTLTVPICLTGIPYMKQDAVKVKVQVFLDPFCADSAVAWRNLHETVSELHAHVSVITHLMAVPHRMLR